ncbi:MAG: hypothetical protein RL060_147 [Bacteroidota bacterium]|jgi:hypothetical protein
MHNHVKAFTLKSSTGILNVLQTPIGICIPQGLICTDVSAIWDTGASGCAITTKVVAALSLTPTGKVQVSTANGIVFQNTYTIDVRLPNSVIIVGIIATEVPGLAGGCDALIGMDIITLGDFSITNHNGNTCMSFRVPSSHEIDYVKNPTYGTTTIKKGGTNITQSKKKRK